MKLVYITIATVFLFFQCLAQSSLQPGPTVTYCNPVIAGDFTDPSVPHALA